MSVNIDGCRSLFSSSRPCKPSPAAPPLQRTPMSGPRPPQVSTLLKALADPVRLRLLSMVASHADGEACVCDLDDAFDLSQPTISHHLKVLHESGLLDRTKRGVWVYYRGAHRGVGRFVRADRRSCRRDPAGETADPQVLFVCVHNAGRSQMAAAYLTHLGAGRCGRVGWFGACRPAQSRCRPCDGRGRHRHPGVGARDADHRSGPSVRRRRHDGMRRHLPDLSWQTLRGLGARRSRGPTDRGRAVIRDDIKVRVGRLVEELLGPTSQS